VIGSIKMTASSAGTANNKVLVGLPVAASANNFLMGSMTYLDSNATAGKYGYNPSAVFYESSTTVSFSVRRTNSDVVYGVTTDDKRFGQDFVIATSTFTGITVESSDIIYVQFMYEAA